MSSYRPVCTTQLQEQTYMNICKHIEESFENGSIPLFLLDPSLCLLSYRPCDSQHLGRFTQAHLTLETRPRKAYLVTCVVIIGSEYNLPFKGTKRRCVVIHSDCLPRNCCDKPVGATSRLFFFCFGRTLCTAPFPCSSRSTYKLMGTESNSQYKMRQPVYSGQKETVDTYIGGNRRPQLAQNATICMENTRGKLCFSLSKST